MVCLSGRSRYVRDQHVVGHLVRDREGEGRELVP
jgi:hypothetical protein